MHIKWLLILQGVIKILERMKIDYDENNNVGVPYIVDNKYVGVIEWLAAVYQNMLSEGVEETKCRQKLADTIGVKRNSMFYKMLKVTPNIKFTFADILFNKIDEVVEKVKLYPELAIPAKNLTPQMCRYIFCQLLLHEPSYLGLTELEAKCKIVVLDMNEER